MKHFRPPPSYRREPRPTAAQLILTAEHARAVARGDLTLHLRPVNSRDHRKRYHAGQRLAVRPGIGATTICHVHVTEVRGPTFDPAPMRLADIAFDDARAAGYRTTLDLKRAWLLRHDAAWINRQTAPDGPYENADDIIEEEINARWARHQHKPVWAVRFIVDPTGTDRLLAGQFTVNSGDYVSSIALALPDEPAALSVADLDTHVLKRAEMTTAQWIALEHATRDAEREELSLGQRLDRAVRECRAAGLSTTREIRVIEKRLQALEQHGQRKAA